MCALRLNNFTLIFFVVFFLLSTEILNISIFIALMLCFIFLLFLNFASRSQK